MDRLRALKVFVAVAETESFTAGARQLGLSGPSATRAVGELEASLGAALFTRTTRRVRLTEGGQAFLDDVREALAQLQSAEEALSGTAENPSGLLRITGPQEFGRIYFGPLVAAFLDAFPAVSVELLLVDRTVNLVEEGYDVALRIGELPSSSLSALRVGSVRHVLCGSPDYFSKFGRPQSPADISQNHQIIAAGRGVGEWRFGHDQRTIVRAQPRLAVNSVAASIEIARQGWGLCRVLSYQVEQYLRDGTLELVLTEDEPPPVPVHIVHQQGRKGPAKVRAFVDFAGRRLRRLPALGHF